jgi:hypothetical protein
MENWSHLLSTISHPCTWILESPVLSRSPSSGSVTSQSVPSSPWNSDTTPTNEDYYLFCRVDNYFVSICGLMWELTCQWPAETFRNFGEDMSGILVSGPRCSKWILELKGDLETLLHVNLTEFIRRRSVSGEVDVTSIGQYLRVSSVVVLRQRTHDPHRFSCNKFVYSMWFLIQGTQYIIQTFPWTRSPVSAQNKRKPHNWSGTCFLA